MINAYEIEEDTIQPLVSAVVSRNSPPSPTLSNRTHGHLRLLWNKFGKHHIFPGSKAVLMILTWNVIVGATYGLVMRGGLLLGLNADKSKKDFRHVLYYVLGIYAFIAVVQVIFYPVGGLIADIWCGRYKIVIISTFKIWLGFFFLLLLIILLAASHDQYAINCGKNGLFITVLDGIAIVSAVILLILGFTGFQANVVQFGLDQLLDASSEEMSVFLHWFVWTDNIGQAAMSFLVFSIPCNENVLMKVTIFSPILFFIIITVTMILSCCKHDWFHSEPRAHNPYGTVYKVLKYTAKHGKPIRIRSAFTYADDERPTRMDFAKQRFGGPFFTETVEDVKTFVRILLMLVAIGPIHALHVAVIYLFPLYGLHLGPVGIVTKKRCNYLNWAVLASGNLTHLVSVVFLPLYIIFILPCVRNSKFFPKILFRLGFGIVLLLLALLSMTFTQVGAHYYHNNATSVNSCLLNSEYFFTEGEIPSLGLPSLVLVVPNFLIGIAVPLIFITILEFISAQSPHTMKGLLLGAFYGVRGLFILVGCILVFPFTGSHFWEKHERSIFDCGVSYYMFNTVFGLVSMVVFCAAAWWYRYRVRDDRPYGPMYVEDYYSRLHLHTNRIEEPVTTLANNSILDYGTTVGQHP